MALSCVWNPYRPFFRKGRKNRNNAKGSPSFCGADIGLVERAPYWHMIDVCALTRREGGSDKEGELWFGTTKTLTFTHAQLDAGWTLPRMRITHYE